MKSLTEQLASLRRELALRRNTYPTWIRQGRMKQDAADHEIACMEAAVATVEKLQWLEEVGEEMKVSAARMGARVNMDKLKSGSVTL